MGTSNPKPTHFKPETTGGACIHNTPCPGIFEWGKVEAGTRYWRKTVIRRECPVCGRRELWNGRLWEQGQPNPHPGVDMRLFLDGRLAVVRA